MDQLVTTNLALFTVALIWLSLGGCTATKCVYEGHIRTEKDWYGFIANATFSKSARMKFRLEYPSDKCCQDLLFYKDEQVSVINARMDCWQKRGLVGPDQILPLTTRYTWSGCHQTYSGDRAVLLCETGRSFSSSGELHTWRIAIANCASLSGVENIYRIEILGHVGPCPITASKSLGTYSYQSEVAPLVLDAPSGEARTAVCTKEGEVLTGKNWHGYPVNISLLGGGGFKFEFTSPYNKQIQKVLLYKENDLKKFSPTQTCWEKESVLTHKISDDQIIELSEKASWNGCITVNKTGKWLIHCRGERRFSSPRNMYLAFSNCDSLSGLDLRYRLDVTGYTGNLCPNIANRNSVPIWAITAVYIVYIIMTLLRK